MNLSRVRWFRAADRDEFRRLNFLCKTSFRVGNVVPDSQRRFQKPQQISNNLSFFYKKTTPLKKHLETKKHTKTRLSLELFMFLYFIVNSLCCNVTNINPNVLDEKTHLNKFITKHSKHGSCMRFLFSTKKNMETYLLLRMPENR